jgi:thioredoxin 1
MSGLEWLSVEVAGTIGLVAGAVLAWVLSPQRRPITAVLGAVIGLAVGGAIGVGLNRPRDISAAEANMVDVRSLDDYKRIVLDCRQPVLVDLYATWCGPCKRLEPTIVDLAKEYDGKIVVARIDIDKAADLTSKLGVTGVPTVILYNQGKETKRWVGGRTHAEYVRAIDQAIKNTPTTTSKPAESKPAAGAE